MSIQILFPSLFALRVACFLFSFFIVVFCWLTAQRQRAQWYTNECAVNEKSIVIIKSSWNRKSNMVYFDRTKFIIYRPIWSLSTTVQSVLMFWFFFRKYTIFLNTAQTKKKHTQRMTHTRFMQKLIYIAEDSVRFLCVSSLLIYALFPHYTQHIYHALRYISIYIVYIYI